MKYVTKRNTTKITINGVNKLLTNTGLTNNKTAISKKIPKKENNKIYLVLSEVAT